MYNQCSGVFKVENNRKNGPVTNKKTGNSHQDPEQQQNIA